MSRTVDEDGVVRDDHGYAIGYYHRHDLNAGACCKPGGVIPTETVMDIVSTRLPDRAYDAAGVRIFDTGATRSNDSQRIDPEGFLSPLALEEYCYYLHKHRLQADGTLRDSDNWQRGIPLTAYMKGMWRHFLHAWQRHRGWTVVDPKAAANFKEDLCAIIFNAQGALHELLKEERRDAQAKQQ